jgi:uncharacterized DUF497 family protein
MDLRMAFEFEWDPAEAATNLAKHGVSFDEASTVFGDPLSSTRSDPRHSLGEARFAILGMSARSRLLAVYFAERGERGERIRIARPAAASGPTMKQEKQAPSEPEGREGQGPEPGAASTESYADIDPDEILPEYDFRGGVRGKYATRYAEGTNVVLLDADVAAAIPDSAAVNSALRALLEIARREVRGRAPAA